MSAIWAGGDETVTAAYGDRGQDEQESGMGWSVSVSQSRRPVQLRGRGGDLHREDAAVDGRQEGDLEDVPAAPGKHRQFMDEFASNYSFRLNGNALVIPRAPPVQPVERSRDDDVHGDLEAHAGRQQDLCPP